MPWIPLSILYEMTKITILANSIPAIDVAWKYIQAHWLILFQVCGHKNQEGC